MSIKNVSILVGAMLLTTMVCLAQKNQVYKNYLQSTGRQKALENVGIKGDLGEWFATLGYTDKTIRDLKDADIDVREALPDYFGRNEKVKTVLSDCIVVGSVVRIEYDSSKTARFHTVVYLAVEEYLRNDYSLKDNEVKIFIESGPLGGGKFGIASHDVKFKVGERALVFLDAAAAVIAAKYNSPEYFQAIIQNEAIQFRVSGLGGGKYLISNGDAVCMGKSKPLKEVIKDIRFALQVLRKSTEIN